MDADNVYEWRAFPQSQAYISQAREVFALLRAGDFDATLQAYDSAMPWDPGINDWDPDDSGYAVPLHIVAALGGPVDEFVAHGAFTQRDDTNFADHSAHLTALVEQRAREFHLDLPQFRPVDLGILSDPQAPVALWLPVPGMRGGFEITRWGEDFQVRSWSRKDMGSGRRHRLTATGAKLVPGGFD
ncbi:hypothetical protein [Corynebacterium pyruviciproducens]|uniref:hypothetical protein n=1 Tax=Corynebacterium pyruviciproducens TaxID=598660 RepID=UPI0023F422FF|nr:hypothetical protein [Corynebacterium pyruviciproducens]